VYEPVRLERRFEGENPEMNPRLKNLTIPGLRWVLALVVLLESAHFAVSPAAALQVTTAGLPRWTVPALGGSEVFAALLFLVPAASVVGGYALLVIFVIATVIHLLHDQFDVGHLVVYSMAVIVCITNRNTRQTGAA
jgi:hypothetical protein